MFQFIIKMVEMLWDTLDFLINMGYICAQVNQIWWRSSFAVYLMYKSRAFKVKYVNKLKMSVAEMVEIYKDNNQNITSDN